MNRKRRSFKQSIFIACEGQTEERYFSAIGDIINDDPKYSVKVRTLEIEDGVPQDPFGLVKEALRIKEDEGHDEAWAVFDKDREPNPQVRINAFQFANLNNINIAYSSIAFEHWVLLHFEKNQNSFSRSDCSTREAECICKGAICVCSYLRETHFPEYRKASYKLYSNLSDKNVFALENAAWLKFRNRAHLSGSLSIVPPYQLNPYTDVDHLLMRLLDLSAIIFSEMNVQQSIANLVFTVTSFTNNALVLRITNNRGIAYVVNDLSDFKIGDNTGTLFSHQFGAPVQINPTETKDVTMTFNGGVAANIIEFRLKEGGVQLIVSL